jgi:hypothetical protein
VGFDAEEVLLAAGAANHNTMIDLALIERLNLSDSNAVATLKSTLREVVSARETSSAADLLARLTPRLAEAPGLSDALSEELMAVRILALPFLPDEEIVRLFSTQLLALTRRDSIDLWTELRGKLLSLPLVDRDVLKDRLVTALRANSETLSAGIINTPQGPRPPTVGNWLRLYERSAGLKPSQEQREQFLSANPDAKALTAADQTALRRTLYLFDRLKLSSLTPEGIEEDLVIEDAAGGLQVMSGGNVVSLTGGRPSAPPPPVPAPTPVVPVPAPPPPPQATASAPAPTQSAVTPTGRPAAPALGHPDDDREIRATQEKLGEATGANETERMENTLTQFIAQHQLSFIEPILEKRFRMIMKSFLKGIRNASATVELLTRATKVGGMAYAPDFAQTLVEAATPVAQSYREAMPVPAPRPPAATSLNAPMPARPKIPTAPQAAAMPPIRVVPAQPATPPPPPEPQYRPKPSPVIRRPDDRPAMSDIQVPSKMTGPVDELRTLTLVDFRRLGADTKQAVARVIEKIDLLGEESFAKRAEGTRAWRESPLYKLYLDMGVESMERGEPINIVISRRATSNRPYLSENEFSAVADLNQQLRF